MRLAKISLKIISILLVAALLAGCPRGETRTLDQVLNTSRTRFNNVKSASVPASVKTELDAALQIIAKFEAGEAGQDSATRLAGHLTNLSGHAGYTARPALDQLTNQVRAIGSSHGEVSSAKARLLAARLYNLLAGELETGRFSL